MASQRQCVASLVNSTLLATSRPRGNVVSQSVLPFVNQTRLAATKKPIPKKKKSKAFKVHDKSKLVQYSLCDAMRYLRAFEVGRPPASVTYDLAVKLQTNKAGATLRDRVRLAYPFDSDIKVAVLCKEDSKTAVEARADGAVAVGEESLIKAIKEGEINFNRLLCHVDSATELNKANLGRILGPKGLMPNAKNNTITADVRSQMRDMVGSEEYRERGGVVRVPVGTLVFTPKMVAANVQVLMAKIKDNMRRVDLQTKKAIDEVVLSSTNGPGFSLNGSFNPTDDKLEPEHLATPV